MPFHNSSSAIGRRLGQLFEQMPAHNIDLSDHDVRMRSMGTRQHEEVPVFVAMKTSIRLSK